MTQNIADPENSRTGITEQVGSRTAIMADRLSRAEIFADLDRSYLEAISGFCSEHFYRDGEIVLYEGDPAERMFVVERGKLALEKRVQLGRHSTPRNATIGYIGSGQIAGFSTVTYPHIYSTSVVCVGPARLIAIDGEPLRDYLRENPDAGFRVMNRIASLISDRYRNATNTLTYFLSVVSHELRSPLAAIENYLQTMHEGYTGELTAKQKRMVQRSILRVTDLRILIGDIVDLARMRPEQIQADFEWFDPGEVGAESIEDVRMAAAEKEISIRVEPPPKFEPIVGARRRMRQVFTNLLNNAIRFSPPGSKVTFRAWYEPEYLYFEVEDEGPGILDEDLPHIFKDFYRASNIQDTQGMGLGLSIAKKIVDAHNGEILVNNRKGENLTLGEHQPNLNRPEPTGAVFKVVIPRDLKTPEMRRQEWMAEEIY